MITNGHRGVGWYHVDAVRLNAHAMADFGNGHGCLFGEQLGKHALMFRIEMLDEDEAHPGISGQVLSKFGSRFDPASRSPYRNDNEVAVVRGSCHVKILFCISRSLCLFGSHFPPVRKWRLNGKVPLYREHGRYALAVKRSITRAGQVPPLLVRFYSFGLAATTRCTRQIASGRVGK